MRVSYIPALDPAEGCGSEGVSSTPVAGVGASLAPVVSVRGALVEAGWTMPPEAWRLPAGSTIVAWSGPVLDEDDADAPGGGDAGSARSLFARSPRSWGPGAMAALDARLDALVPRLRDAGLTLLIRPHERHVVSDPRGMARLAERFAPGPVGLLPDPAGLLAPAMAPFAEDHLERAFDALEALARVPGAMPLGVLVRGVAPGAGSAAEGGDAFDAPALRSTTVDDPASLIAPALWRRLIRARWPRDGRGTPAGVVPGPVVPVGVVLEDAGDPARNRAAEAFVADAMASG